MLANEIHKSVLNKEDTSTTDFIGNKTLKIIILGIHVIELIN